VVVALDATPLANGPGGVSRYTVELARALALRYREDEFYLVSDQRFAMPPDPPPNLRAGTGPQNAAERRWWLWGLRRELSRIGASLFHGTDFSVPYSRSRPGVMTLHDLSPWLDPGWQPNGGRVRRRTPYLLRLGLATFVITPSEAVRQAAIARFGLDPARVAAVPLAASEFFKPAPRRDSERPYLLYVGTLEPRKNIPVLIEAWREVRRHFPIDLVLAGRTREDFRAPEPEAGLRVLGKVPEEDLPGLYTGALAFVYPSLYEGFGLPVLEAMQCGALVVASRDPAIREVVGTGNAVQVDTTAGARPLAEALMALARFPNSFANLRARAIERAREFTWTRTAELTRDVYDDARRAFRKKKKRD
jgi:glycosyltransferase involved in cell wall biosynthesis